MDVGERVKVLREKLGWEQLELAHRIGISQSKMNKIETGYQKRLEPEILTALAKELRTTTDYLLGNSDIQYPSWGDEAAFEEWLNDPKVDKFYKEFKESPEERREALLAAWEYLKSLDKK